MGISDVPAILRQMCLDWGVIPLADVPTDSHHAMLEGVTRWGLAEGMLARGDHFVLVAGGGLGRGSHNQIVVHEVP